ncbi:MULTISPECIES: periplasmic heavy metal sensor [unclassified Sphingomonas]|uniref:periplasmic heavy metal sensor n=1 Tax=unclassified Sphingomonas TaxID=196159 RepID=UPI00226A7E13|nr:MULTISPECIES: periplasmic heavy metal sensor [unclassified Sphingomonas]
MGRIRTALALSVLLNLFLAAALIAGVVSLRRGGGTIAAGALRIAGVELPPAERQSFRKALRDTRRAMRPTILDGRDARAEAATLLRAPTLDPNAVAGALDRARTSDMAVRAAVERRAIAYAATLSPANRAKLADAMDRRAERGRPIGR